MTAVPLSSAPVKPEHQNHLKIGFTQLAGQWQDPQPVDGQQAIRYAVQLQWADAAGKVRQSAPRIMTPRLCSRAQWNKMRGTLDRGMCLQAAPAPDGTICLTPESTRGWPGATPFVTKLDTSGPKVTSPGTKLESTAVDFGTFTCRLYNEGQRKRFRGTPVWSSDGTAFFVVTAEGLLRKIAKSDFSVLASMQLVAPPGTEPKRQPVLDLFPSSEGPIAMVADGFPVKFWVLDEETLAVKRGFGMPNMYLRSSSKSPIVYVPNINGLTIVDFSTGKVLRHLGERKKPREITEQMLWTPRVRDPMRVTPDGLYLVIPSRDSRARESLAVYRIDKDQLTFDAKAAAAMPSGMTREVMLGRALGKLAGPATGQYGARVPFDFLHGYGDPAVTVSPNGKEMVVLVEAKLCYSPQLPDISEVQQQQADLRKAREQKELAARKRREEMMNRNKSPSNSGVVVPSIRPPGVSPPPVAGPK